MGTVTAVVRIIAKRTLREFWGTHPDAKDVLEAWHSAVRRADWDSPEKVIQQYSRASIIGSDRVVFRLKGGRYRLIVSVNYVKRLVFIRFVGTHSEYERINAEEV